MAAEQQSENEPHDPAHAGFTPDSDDASTGGFTSPGERSDTGELIPPAVIDEPAADDTSQADEPAAADASQAEQDAAAEHEEQLTRLFTATVTGPGDERIGKVGQVYLDDQTQEPNWITVKTGLFGSKEYFVPLDEAQLEGKHIIVPYTKADVADAPATEIDQNLSPDEEDALYNHYRVPGRVTGEVESAPPVAGPVDSPDDADTSFDLLLDDDDDAAEVEETPTIDDQTVVIDTSAPRESDAAGWVAPLAHHRDQAADAEPERGAGGDPFPPAVLDEPSADAPQREDVAQAPDADEDAAKNDTDDGFGLGALLEKDEQDDEDKGDDDATDFSAFQRPDR